MPHTEVPAGPDPAPARSGRRRRKTGTGLRGAGRARGPRQDAGDPCDDCGTVLVQCLQCGTEVRCLTCRPYERPSPDDEETDEAVRTVREHPQLGLLAGVIAAAVPAAFLWAGLSMARGDTLRLLIGAAGAAACCACLGAGAAIGKSPLTREVPMCRRPDSTPYDRWFFTAAGALAVEVALVCIGIAAA